MKQFSTGWWRLTLTSDSEKFSSIFQYRCCTSMKPLKLWAVYPSCPNELFLLDRRDDRGRRDERDRHDDRDRRDRRRDDRVRIAQYFSCLLADSVLRCPWNCRAHHLHQLLFSILSKKCNAKSYQNYFLLCYIQSLKSQQFFPKNWGETLSTTWKSLVWVLGHWPPLVMLRTGTGEERDGAAVNVIAGTSAKTPPKTRGGKWKVLFQHYITLQLQLQW